LTLNAVSFEAIPAFWLKQRIRHQFITVLQAGLIPEAGPHGGRPTLASHLHQRLQLQAETAILPCSAAWCAADPKRLCPSGTAGRTPTRYVGITEQPGDHVSNPGQRPQLLLFSHAGTRVAVQRGKQPGNCSSSSLLALSSEFRRCQGSLALGTATRWTANRGRGHIVFFRPSLWEELRRYFVHPAQPADLDPVLHREQPFIPKFLS
jgi:hypothetical protein